MARKTPFQFVDLHGRPFDPARRGADAADAQARSHAALVDPADAQTVFDALVVGGWRRGKTPLTTLLKALEWRRADGRQFTVPDTAAALHRLAGEGRVTVSDGEGWRADAAAARERLPVLLARPEAATWWRRWIWAAGGGLGRPDGDPRWADVRDDGEALALARLVLLGVDAATYNRLSGHVLHRAASAAAIGQALDDLLATGLFDRVQAELRWGLLVGLERHGLLERRPALVAWVDAAIDAQPAAVPPVLRLGAVERRLQRGDADGMRRAMPDDADAAPYRQLFEAALLAWQGRFAEAAEAFPSALKTLGAALGQRKALAPQRLLQWYVLALMAQPDARAWTTARKLCVAESGSRQPEASDPWGLWAHALAVRLGDARLEAHAFEPTPVARGPWARAVDADREADRLLLAAWLDHRPAGWTAASVAALAASLHRDGLPWKADLIGQACERLGLAVPARPADATTTPWPVRYYAPAQAAWRDALAAIVALGDGRAGSAASPLQTLRWRLTLDAEGRPFDLQAFEPPASSRGRPKAVSLLQLKRRERLDPRDAAVARCIRSSRYRASEVSLDLAGAVQALVGHPALELADAPGVAVELRESLPVLHVHRQRLAGVDGDGEAAEHFVFELEDALLADAPPVLEHHEPPDCDARAAEAEKRDALRVVREAPQRARLIRITPAQRRVAELVAKRWAVPVAARAELDAALRVLAGHFVLHSDAEAGEPVPSDARLVAQLQPRGQALQLQLAVRPFGDFGPLIVPGAGRARLLTLHHGIGLATERALDAERAHLAAALEAMPFLGELPPDATWLLEDAEDALAAVHALGRLMAAPAESAAVAPVRAVEWPRGQPLRVHAPVAGALHTALRSGRDWFALDGELRLEEGRVVTLQRLLALLREAGGRRFVALGEGEYLALTERLRQRLADLDALAEPDAGRLKLGATAAAWLGEAADDLGLAGDARWRERAARLEEAAALAWAPPPGLHAELRPYQVEGCTWLARLAHAGFGACLADDMGLGKTVQTLALLLQRAPLGAALVVAPTSVCANWAAEAARFTPALQASVYGGTADDAAGGRSAQAAAAGPGDLVVVSYALLLRDAETFAARPWATLVLDEAQALKNAATQRVKAVAALDAGFRLALSGTPVENRLADLWSIMQLLNPGLLGSAQRFAERFGNPIERQRDERARARLKRLVAPFLLRRTKAQVLADLPPRTEIVERVEPTADERAFLEAARRAALERVAALQPGDAKSAFNVLAELMRLRRAACDPRLVAPEFGLVGAKVQAFERLARELVEGRHQALVFSQFTDFLKLLAERLDAAGLRYRVLDGSTPAPARAERVAAFQRGEADLFLISLKAGGFGLNLTAADYVVIADPWWNPAVEDQAMGRAHRIGQLRPVTVYRLVTAGSIEERIVELHRDKRDLAEGLLAAQDGGAPLRADELLELLRG